VEGKMLFRNHKKIIFNPKGTQHYNMGKLGPKNLLFFYSLQMDSEE